ncbi:MAG: OmpH family outer membrane protein [Alphaproteobacteria bacterium]|nr:OmpH family outer membrane protein [Alphaproteobacteria bacterium]
MVRSSFWRAAAIAGALAAASAASVPPAAAQQLPAPIVMIVDIQGVQQGSKAFKSIQGQMQTHRQSFQKEIGEQENQLRSAEQELQRQRTILAPEAFAQKQREFQERVNTVQRNAQSRRRQLEEAFNEAMQQVQRALLTVVGKLAEERGATLVLPKSLVVLVDKKYDVSDEALKRLDQSITQVSVKLPAKK